MKSVNLVTLAEQISIKAHNGKHNASKRARIMALMCDTENDKILAYLYDAVEAGYDLEEIEMTFGTITLKQILILTNYHNQNKFDNLRSIKKHGLHVVKLADINSSFSNTTLDEALVKIKELTIMVK